ncbi:hypothetical protein D5086_014392 [Populus alba]|uniref:Uncharacterized protein n=1 Tax=Populus alba TaxID=43335 RepID=A0ACC4BY31_POPAL
MRPLNSVVESSRHALYNVFLTHCQAFKSGIISHIYVANNILFRYSKCYSGDLNLACKLFDEMPHKDTVTWNTMITGYVESGNLGAAWEFLKSMKRRGFQADGYTFGSILKGVAHACRHDLGQQVHSLIVKIGYEQSVYAGSALLDMYAKCERVEDAYDVFQGMPVRNFVSWNALIDGFAQVGDRDTAFWLLDCMQKEGVRVEDGTFAPLLTLLDGDKFYKLTMQLHCKIIKHGLEFYNALCNATLTAYSECGLLEDAKRVFDGAVVTRDLVTWNSMLVAYLVHDKDEDAFNLFLEMQGFGFEPDIYTYTCVISACFAAAHKKYGKSFHALVIKRGLEESVTVCNALITMYLKLNNKSMEAALNLFHSMKSKDRVSWNSILTGFSQMGFSEDALKLFGHMRSSLEEIDDYAYSAVLRSCSDLAILQLGQQIHLLTVKTGFDSNDFVASSLIFMACGNIELAAQVASQLLEVEPEEHCTYVILSNMYGHLKRWDDKASVTRLMRERKVKKVPVPYAHYYCPNPKPRCFHMEHHDYVESENPKPAIELYYDMQLKPDTHAQTLSFSLIVGFAVNGFGLCEGGYEDFELHALETTTSIWSSSRDLTIHATGKTGEYCWSGTRECTCCMCECGECSSMHGEEMAGEGAARSMGAGLEVEEETEIDKDTEEESSDYKMERRYLRSAVARVATRRSNRRASGTPCMFPHDFFFVRDYCG